ncbi:hypothetical protein JOB18_020146 [Solea senegalensis]|uniref:Ig-like domain-containing protein n=1 Tax=Solea senegalensis TaxID=28829 RepID=A0AAV6RY48_SOLSE|nr:hypothetical protein JOB18_020146 [Solea senegalensis]
MKNKMITAFCITLNIMLISGSSLSDKVKQTPAHVFKKPTETVNIRCSHSIDNYNRIFCMTSNTVLVSGSSASDNVQQTPAHMVKKSTETANISCSHSINSYYQILWYNS